MPLRLILSTGRLMLSGGFLGFNTSCYASEIISLPAVYSCGSFRELIQAVVPLRLFLSTGYLMLSGRFLGINTSRCASEINSLYRVLNTFGSFLLGVKEVLPLRR